MAERTIISRRGLVQAGTAGLGAAGLPAAALAMAVPAPASDPDAVLTDLIARHAVAFEARNAHADAHAAAEDRYAAATPKIPDTLLLRRDDAFGVTRFMGQTGNGRGVGGLWFDGNAVDALRTMTPPPYLVERRAEIVTAFDRWEHEVNAVYDRTGMKAADEEDDRLSDVVASAELAVLDAVPTTLTGFRAKARWMTAREGWEEHAAVVVRDLAGLDAVPA